MKIKTFKGNPREIGRQQGKIYRINGMNLEKIKINSKLFKNQLSIYRKHYPEFLDELRGIAEGGNFNEEKTIYYFITGELLVFVGQSNLKKACTIFGVKNKSNVYIGRNYDWCPQTEKIFEIYKMINRENNNFVAITDMAVDLSFTGKPDNLFYNADDVINDKGLFIGITFAFGHKWSYGLSCIHITKLIAETCTTVDDVLKLFHKVPLCYPKNFFIADANGKMAVVEHTSKEFKILYPKDDVLIQTNHYVDQKLALKDTVLSEDPTSNTFLRYYEALQKINMRKKNFRFYDIMKILAEKQSYICQNHPDIKTIWSLALDVKKKKYKLYYDLFGERKEKALKI